MAKQFDQLPWEEQRVILKRMRLEQTLADLEADKETITALYEKLPEKPVYRKTTGEIDDVKPEVAEPVEVNPEVEVKP